jgi:hypothetical protein
MPKKNDRPGSERWVQQSSEASEEPWEDTNKLFREEYKPENHAKNSSPVLNVGKKVISRPAKSKHNDVFLIVV